ncbi:MAG TPA: DUF1015 domain-containing protein [Candidatus Dormibacteraeota bacterium]|jgi:uncharacterized protein (DUF1015 family)|nr:DUF1015 domain-containing protein [Candidatus Dormibacteraeota bacterium]
MADIHPFRAFRYDPHQVSLSQVVTQPYDKITPTLQDHYYAASPHNLVRIILGRREENDNPANHVYSRAAAHFRDWRQQGMLRQDSLPSIYIYSQRFTLPNSTTELERRGFIALARIEDYSAGVVFRHEQTLAKPKADRLDLLRATRAHFGQIFMLYEDSGQIDSLLTTSADPDIVVTDDNGVVHRVWQVSDPNLIASVQTAMSDKKLIIADGHHRYETALTYRNERRAADSLKEPAVPTPAQSPYDFVMMTFVNMNSPALLILPTHRLVHSLPEFSEESFRTSARAFFDVDEIDPNLDAPRATAILRESGRCGTTILAVTANRAFLLHHPNPNTPQVFAGLSLRQQALDVVQLHKCLLEKVLNLSEESIRNQQNISYIRDAAEALSQVRTPGTRAQIAFLMNPCRMAQVRDIAFANEVMPQKSTDFYPKLLSGLTIYALD